MLKTWMSRTAVVSASQNLPTREGNRNKQIHKYDTQLLISTVEKIKVCCGPGVGNIFSEEVTAVRDLNAEDHLGKA